LAGKKLAFQKSHFALGHVFRLLMPFSTSGPSNLPVV